MYSWKASHVVSENLQQKLELSLSMASAVAQISSRPLAFQARHGSASPSPAARLPSVNLTPFPAASTLRPRALPTFRSQPTSLPIRSSPSRMQCSLPPPAVAASSTAAAAALAAGGGSAVTIASHCFTLCTAAVIPLYTLMIFAPDWHVTEHLMSSSLPSVLLGFVYLYLLALSWTPNTIRCMFASKYWMPELPGITQMFSSTLTVASAWIHLLALDLFAARHVYLDGLKRQLETRHSLVLCLMFGPLGIAMHALTSLVANAFGRSRKNRNRSREVEEHPTHHG